MSYIDDADLSEDFEAVRQELAELRAAVAEVHGETAARSALNEAELAKQIAEAESPEQVTELVAAANRIYVDARFGAGTSLEVDV
jgi:hypothetical protein